MEGIKIENLGKLDIWGKYGDREKIKSKLNAIAKGLIRTWRDSQGKIIRIKIKEVKIPKKRFLRVCVVCGRVNPNGYYADKSPYIWLWIKEGEKEKLNLRHSVCELCNKNLPEKKGE